MGRYVRLGCRSLDACEPYDDFLDDRGVDYLWEELEEARKDENFERISDLKRDLRSFGKTVEDKPGDEEEEG